MPTLKEIAEKANVSVATVSYVLNGKDNVKESTKALVRQTIADLENQCREEEEAGLYGKSLAGNVIGVIAEDICMFNTPEIIHGVCTAAKQTGVHVLLNNLNLIELSGEMGLDEILAVQQAKRAVTFLVSHGVDGIIYIGCTGREIRNIASDYNIPIVYAYCFSHEEDTHSVTYKDEDTAYELAMYLVENRHKNIAVVAGPEDYIHVRSRMAGFQRAMFDAGILFNVNHVIFGDWDNPKTGYEAMEKLADSGVTAVYCLNDTLASGVMEYARTHHIKIPEELSVTGFDGIEDGKYTYSRLTSVHLPLEEIGRVSFARICNIMAGQVDDNSNQVTYIPSKIDYRKSVAAAVEKAITEYQK